MHPATCVRAVPDNDEVLEQLRRMLACRLFARSKRLSGFLRFTVEQTLLKRPERLKEYAIGLAVFSRPESFDPRVDAIVRVVAGRLRTCVERYYETDGAKDRVLIEFQAGSYVPELRFRTRPDTAGLPADSQVLCFGSNDRYAFARKCRSLDSESVLTGRWEHNGVQAPMEICMAASVPDSVAEQLWSELRVPVWRKAVNMALADDPELILLRPPSAVTVVELLETAQRFRSLLEPGPG